VVGAMGRSPLFLAKVSQSLAGKRFDDIAAVAQAGKDAVNTAAVNTAAAFAAHNAGAALAYRQTMVETMVVRALEQAAAKASMKIAR